MFVSPLLKKCVGTCSHYYTQQVPLGYKISTLGYKGKYIRNFTKSQHENMNKSLNKQNTLLLTPFTATRFAMHRNHAFA